MFTFSYAKIKKYAYCICALPFIVFAIGWLKWYWAVVAVIAIFVCVYSGVFQNEKEQLEDNENISVKPVIFAGVAAITLFWVWQSGMGGFWAQSSDYPWRNAIYRDIVLRDWPVFYEKYGGALVYYIGFWLVPALFGKIALFLGAGSELAFQVASVAVFVWTILLIMILFSLLFTLLHADTGKKQLLVVLGFIFFSGMDILGVVESFESINYHLEWWAYFYQYSSFTTCLFWVFNQSVIPWILFACLLQEKTVQNYVFLGMMCLFSGPLPFVGFFIYCIAFAIRYGIAAFRSKEVKEFLKKLFSLSNILAALFLFIIIATYLLSNTAISGGGALRVEENAVMDEEEVEAKTDTWAEDFFVEYGTYFSFVLFEFGIYALLICRNNKKNPLFYVTIMCLLIFPFLKIGNGKDFPMRASIPALVYMYYLVMQFLMAEKKCLAQKGTINKKLYITLVITLILGSFTPLMEFYRGGRQVIECGLDNPEEDYLYTLGGDSSQGVIVESGYEYANFVSLNTEGQIFFKYFAQKLK